MARSIRVVDILHPLRGFLYGTRIHIYRQIRLGTEELAHVQEFMGAEAIVFAVVAPPQVFNRLSFAFGAYALLPVVGICKTPSRPAQVGDVQVAKRLDDIVANPIGIRDFCMVFPHVEPIVDTAPEVLCKMPVNMLADARRRLVGVCQGLVLLAPGRYAGQAHD